jgi:ABC-type transport system involved in multi-copper enzyme maturation permease subunit
VAHYRTGYVIVPTAASGEGAGRRISLGEPSQEVRELVRRLRRQQIPLAQKTRDALQDLLAEVNLQSETTWQERPGETAEERNQRLGSHLAEWDSQILSRAKAILDDRQYGQFQAIQERNHDQVLQRLTRWNQAKVFYYWLIYIYFFIIQPLACVLGCGPLIRDELQADTLGFLITRPVGRARLLIVKYISQVAWLELVLLLETLLIFAAGAVRHVPSLGGLLPLVLGVQVLVIPAWSALGLLLGQITTRYMATAFLYGALVEMGIGNIPTNINALSILRHLKTLLSHNSALQSTLTLEAGGTATALCALMAAPVIFLGIAALLFKMVEYHHAAEMQK